MFPKGLGPWFRERQAAIFAAKPLDFGFPIFPKLFDGSMRAFGACHYRPLALCVREADNESGFESCDLNLHGLGWSESAVCAAGQAFSNIGAHQGPVLFPYEGLEDWPFAFLPPCSVSHGTQRLWALLFTAVPPFNFIQPK